MINLKLLSKEERANQAKRFTDIITHQFKDEINDVINHTRVYDDNLVPDIKRHYGRDITDITLYSADTIKCVMNVINGRWGFDTGRIAILNFASYKHPGGQFLSGSSAQEESICHHSILYPVLEAFKEDYYEVNQKKLNRALYTNKALYTENCRILDTVMDMQGHVDFIKGDYKVDVITCAAPNLNAFYKYKDGSKEDEYIVKSTIESRIEFIYRIAKMRNVDTLILGAFGCGVFKNDPEFVVKTFLKVLKRDYDTDFRNIFFAVPRDKNYDAFKKVFCEYKEDK